MAFIPSDLDALDKAIKSSRSKVKYADKEVEYRSMDEMFQARNFIMDELERTGQLAQQRKSQTSYASFSRD
jgi:hypothetical protein